MIRGILFLLVLLAIAHAVRTVFRSAVEAFHGHGEERATAALGGEDMVRDPECNTFVPLRRAVTRRVGGTVLYFCSEECAKRHTEKRRT